jgi:hypothetical protein
MTHMEQTLFALIVQNSSYERSVISDNGRSCKMFSLQTAGGTFSCPGLTDCFSIIIFSFLKDN